MANLFDGPKSVLNDITKLMQKSNVDRVNNFVDEAISKGKTTPTQIGEYAHHAKKDGRFAAQVKKAAEDRLK